MLPVWLGISALLLFAFGRAAWTMTLPDTDDHMRLVQVRDWLAGQSWWDVTQYRMDPPGGVAMHWSRLVDLPIAGLILLFSPLGRPVAEALAVTLVPLVTLGVIIWTTAATARRLLPDAATPALAALLGVTSAYVVTQCLPGRIDHHGWQMAMAALALLGLVDPRGMRGGLVAGAALATGLAISIEGLPFAAACGVACGLRWAFCDDDAEAGRLTGFGLALAGGSAGLFVATRPASGWLSPWCDIVTPGHLAAIAVAGLGVALIARIGGRRPMPVRLALLAGIGALAVAAFLAIVPACAADPFGRLDPLVRRVWYLNVMEGQPIWRQRLADRIEMLFFPLIGLSGALLAATRGRTREWLTVALLLLAATATAMLVRRATGVAHLVAVPGALWLILALVARARAAIRPPLRSLATVAAVLLLSPLASLYADALLLPASAPKPPPPARDDCDMICALRPVAALPPALILTPIDLGPIMLSHTHHRVVGGPYHRAPDAIGDVIRIYAGTADAARTIIRRRRVDYVLVEPGSDEAAIYRRMAPAGLMARLSGGRPPGWLTPVPVGPGPLRLWRVAG